MKKSGNVTYFCFALKRQISENDIASLILIKSLFNYDYHLANDIDASLNFQTKSNMYFDQTVEVYKHVLIMQEIVTMFASVRSNI